MPSPTALTDVGENSLSDFRDNSAQNTLPVLRSGGTGGRLWEANAPTFQPNKPHKSCSFLYLQAPSTLGKRLSPWSHGECRRRASWVCSGSARRQGIPGEIRQVLYIHQSCSRAGSVWLDLARERKCIRFTDTSRRYQDRRASRVSNGPINSTDARH